MAVDWASFQEALAAIRRPGTAWSPDLHRRLDTYSGLIAEWGEAINMTGVRSPQALVDSLFVESLAGPAAFPELFGARRRVADLGSGAGFPGMVLALACPDLEVTLFEASRKKAAFLEEVRLRTGARVAV
ncbi:MAG: RsmG family class I SAM-dependent methyltransferase, partial [bacterium]